MNIEMADEQVLKVCAKCKVAKPLSEFFMRSDRGGRRVPRSRCKSPCMEEDRAEKAEANTARARKWREDDLERARASVRACYASHKEERAEARRKLREYPAYLAREKDWSRAWKKAHPENVKASLAKIADWVKAYQKKYNQDHPDQCAVYRNRRRALIAEAEGDHSDEDIADIRRMQKDKCAYCRKPLKGKGAVDHIVALAKGGTNDRRNLQLVCKSCNSKKHAMDAIDFVLLNGGLI